MLFYPADWIADTRFLSLEARGAWIDLLCAMWTAPKRGELHWTLEMFQNFLRVSSRETDSMKVWRELVSANVAEMTLENDQCVTIMSRRMVREEVKRNQARTRQSRKRSNDKASRSRRIYHKSEVISHISEEDKEKNKKAQAPLFILPDWIPKTEWDSFIEFRKSIRKPLKERGITLAVGVLRKLKDQGSEPAAVIDQSILNGWAGLFPIKLMVAQTQNGSNGDELSEQTKRILRRGL